MARVTALVFSIYGLVASAVSLLGWAIDMPRLSDWDGNGIAMQPNAAAVGMVVGAAMLCLVAGRPLAVRVAAILVTAIAAATAFENLTSVDLGIDRVLLFGREWGGQATSAPGRMGIPGSVSWTLLGIALLLAVSSERRRRLVPVFTIVVMLVAALSLVGHLLDASLLYALPRYTAVAWQTSTITMASAVALLAALPSQQPMKRVLEDSAAGLFVRRTLPMIVVLPLVLAWLRQSGERAGWFDSAMGLALLTILLVALLIVVMWRGATAVARHERSLAAAHAASARADMVLRTASDQFALLDGAWRYIYVNDRVAEVTGIRREAMIGRTFWDVWPAVLGTPLETVARRVMALRTPESLVYHYAPWDRWFDIRLHPTPDGGVALLLLEVTARRRVEEELRLREQQLQLITDAMPALISYVDRDQRYRFVNRWYETWFGQSRELLIGRPMKEVLGKAAMERLQPFIDRAFAGEAVRFESETPYREAGTRWIDAHYVPDRDADGRVVGLFVLVLDITERKRAESALRDSEARLSAILEHLPVGMGLIDGEGRLVLGSRLMREFVPETIPSLDPARRARWQAWRPDGSPLPPSEWPGARALRGEDASGGTEFLFKGDDGRERWTLVGAVPFRSATGEALGAISLVQDITARKRDESALRASEEALRDADRRKDEFLATLAHELRNPLAPLMNSIEIMKRASDRPALSQQAITTMERQITHMVRLVDDLLDVSRITRNTLELRRERVALGPILQHAIEACRPLIDGGRHTLHVELPEEPILVDADQVRLTQVFGNLLTNACRYTEPGGEIVIRVWREGDDVLTSVRDNGVGIPPEMLEKVFEMFTQVPRPLERSHGGLGVGLTLVKRLVEMHGGAVTARSEGVGRGSEFIVRLPRAADAPLGHAALRVNGGAVPAALRRILVADDNRDTAESLATLLRLSGCEVEIAGDGIEAVERATANHPDAVLLDIGLPRLNGYDACRALRATPWGRHAVIIAVTGWGQEQDRQRSAEAGFDGHVVKPVEFETLSRVLAAAARGAAVG